MRWNRQFDLYWLRVKPNWFQEDEISQPSFKNGVTHLPLHHSSWNVFVRLKSVTQNYFIFSLKSKKTSKKVKNFRFKNVLDPVDHALVSSAPLSVRQCFSRRRSPHSSFQTQPGRPAPESSGSGPRSGRSSVRRGPRAATKQAQTGLRKLRKLSAGG